MYGIDTIFAFSSPMKTIFRYTFLFLLLLSLGGAPTYASSSATVTASLTPSDIPFLVRDKENKVATLTLTASGGDIDVQRITINYFGTAEKNDIYKARLYAEWGSYIDTAKITEGALSFTNPGPIALHDGETKTFMLIVELSSSARTGRTLGFELRGKGTLHVETTRYDEKLVALGEKTRTNALFILGEDGGAVLLPKFTDSYSSAVSRGESVPLADFSIRAEGEESGMITSLTFRFTGANISQSVKNIVLSSPQMDTEKFAPVSSSGTIVFTPDIPFSSGETLSFVVMGDVLDSAPEGTEIQLELESAFDLIASSREKSVLVSGEFPLRGQRRTVSLSSLAVTPAENFSPFGSIPRGAGNVPLFALDFTSAAEDVTVSSLVLARKGLWEKDSVDEFRLQAEGNNEVFRGNWKNNREIEFQTSFIVPAGEKRQITIFGDISRETSDNISIGLALESNTSIVALGETGASVPVRIPLETTASKTIGQEKEEVLHLKIIDSPNALLSGTQDNILATFSAEVSGDTPLEVRKIVSNISGISGEALTNVRLVSSTGDILSRGIVAGNTLIFSDAFPVLSGEPLSLFLRADVSASEKTSFHVSIEEASALSVIDLVSREGVSVTGAFPLETNTFDLQLFPEKSAVIVSSVFVPGKEVSRGEKDVTWGKIRLLATQNNEQVTRLAFLIPKGAEDTLENIRFVNGGMSYRGDLETGLVIFEENIRLEKDQESEWSLVGDVRAGAALGSSFWYTITNAAQIRTSANAESIPVLGGFPLMGNQFKVGENEPLFCTMTYQPVCGRTYSSLPCPSSEGCTPINITFSNSCELNNAKATFLYSGSCDSPESVGEKPVFPLPVTSDFPDVSETNTFRDAIVSLKENKIVQGFSDGTFRPEDSIGRAAFLKIVMGAIADANDFSSCATEEAKDGVVFFSDVPENEWFAPYVCEAVRRGIVNGYPDGTFRPGNDVSFAEAAKIAGIAFGAEFSGDVPWYEPFVRFLSERRAIPIGVSQLSHVLTRGEMAEIIWRLRDRVTNKESYSAEEVLSNN